MVLVFVIIKDFGSAAQAGFGVGVRVLQASFLPVIAISFAASPVAGQNFGAHQVGRVRETFKISALICSALMLLITALAHIAPDTLIRAFSKDTAVIAFGAQYLRIISYNFVASGLIFAASSMFQAMGNTLPPLGSSCLRILLFAIPAWMVFKIPGFKIEWIWYLSLATVLFQMCLNLYLLRREFRKKLDWMVAETKEVEVVVAV